MRVPRRQVLDVLRQHDPAANQARQERILWRSFYDVDEPMKLWHIDSYEKLLMYGFYVHAGIDGGTNFIVYATVALSKTFAALKAGFDAAVYKFDFPEKLRADMAWETQAIGQAMLDARGAGTYLTGPSTANQRIENWWNFLKTHCATYYRALFQAMERFGVLDRFNPEDLFSLTQVFLKPLQEAVTKYSNMWNFHPIRPQASRNIQAYIPVQRFIAGRSGMSGLGSDQHRSLMANLATHPEIMDAARALDTDVVGATGGTAARQPAVRDPLSGEWGAIRDATYAAVADEALPSVQKYILHRMVCKQLVNLRTYVARPGAHITRDALLALPIAAEEMFMRNEILRTRTEFMMRLPS